MLEAFMINVNIRSLTFGVNLIFLYEGGISFASIVGLSIRSRRMRSRSLRLM